MNIFLFNNVYDMREFVNNPFISSLKKAKTEIIGEDINGNTFKCFLITNQTNIDIFRGLLINEYKFIGGFDHIDKAKFERLTYMLEQRKAQNRGPYGAV